MDEETTMTVPVEELVAVGNGSDVAVIIGAELEVADGKTFVFVVVDTADVTLSMMLDSTDTTDETTSVAEAEDKMGSTLDSTESIDDRTDVMSVG